MSLTIGVPLDFGHDSDATQVNRPGGADLLEAIYQTVHGYLPGTQELAQRMRIPLDTLRQKANRNNPQHVFHPEQLLDLMRATGNVAVLHAMNAAMGYTGQRAAPDASGGDPMESFMALQVAIAEFVKSLADPYDRMGHEARNPAPTKHELQRADMRLQELLAAANHAYAVLRAKAVPAVEA